MTHAEQMTPMIDIHQLGKTYPGKVVALNQIDLHIGTGMFGLLGPNGAGKTTLIRILSGLLRPSQGTVRVFGHDLAESEGRKAVKALLGYLPQELGLYPYLNAHEFLDYVAILKGLHDPHVRRRQIDELLEIVRLGDAAGRKLRTYSGGMKRRVGIAQALLGTPQLIIVDEPTAGLDPEERVRIRNVLGDLARRCTVILSTHIIEDIGASCNALAILARGQVQFQGTPGDLVRHARGKVWTLHVPEPITRDTVGRNDFAVIGTLQLADGVQYRLVGEGLEALHPGVRAVEPTLEDGYIWLMRQRNQAA